MKRLAYLTRNYKSTANGGGKARVDTEEILSAAGAVNLGLKRTHHKNKVADFFLNLAGIARYMCCVRKGDAVLLQYPVKKYFTFLCRWGHLRGAKVVALVHDLGSFRRKRITVRTELRRLSCADVVIAANSHTVNWLRQKGLSGPMVEQHAWDFLSEKEPGPALPPPLSVAFIGDLSMRRNPFIYSLPAGIELHLYGGKSCGGAVGENTTVHGYVSPDCLIEGSKGRYGLIWYGTSAESPAGAMGEYLAYNNPHKLSLYLRAGKPVIVWSGSGVADFVRREGIGIAVDTLTHLDDVLSGITDARYREMRRNVSRVSEMMRQGRFLRSALQEAISLLSK